MELNVIVLNKKATFDMICFVKLLGIFLADSLVFIILAELPHSVVPGTEYLMGG